jgi:hypothetical protein
MSDFSGIFLRHALGDTPNGGGGGAFSASPDIIPYGTSPMQDTSIAVSPSGYNTEYGSSLYLKQDNFVYIRGLNTTGGPTESRLWLFYTPSDLALWPQIWSAANISYMGRAQNYAPVKATTANQIIMNDQPLIWSPPPASAGSHYCMIAISETPPAPTPVSPLPTAGFTSLDQLAAFILAHPNMAWRNTTDVSINSPTWQYTIPITGPEVATTVFVGVKMENIPVGSIFSFNVPGPDAQNTIIVNNQAVMNPNERFSVAVAWPANFATTMTISFTQGAVPPPPGSSITPFLAIESSSLVSLSEPAAARLNARVQTMKTFTSAAMAETRHVQLFPLGAMEFRFK